MVKRTVLVLILLLSLAAVVQAQGAKPQLIEIGQAVTGTLADSSAEASYQFSAQAGDFLIITMNSENLDSTITVEGGADITGYPYFYDDDSGGNYNSRLAFIIPETGTYIVTARTYTGEGGSYELAISRGTTSPLEFDQPTDVTFDVEHAAFYFTFTGKAGEVVDLGGTSTDGLDTRLAITGPDGSQTGYDDDSGGDFNPLISSAVLPADGEYLVSLYPYSVPASGTVTVTLTHSVIESLDGGPVVFALGDKQSSGVTSFTGVAGEVVTLTLTLQSGDNLNPYITITQGQETIASLNASTVQHLSFDLAVPGDGLVVINIEQYYNATMELSLTRAK